MLGLKTQETKKIEKFIELIQNEAAKKEKVFFLDAGDGRDFETNDMEGEDLTGWLIPSSKVDEFKIVWEKDEADDDWIDFFTFVSWQKKDGRITVTFKAS